MTPWEAAITAIVIANGLALTALALVVALHLRDVARARRQQGNR